MCPSYCYWCVDDCKERATLQLQILCTLESQVQQTYFLWTRQLNIINVIFLFHSWFIYRRFK
jgi:hypothetical protein